MSEAILNNKNIQIPRRRKVAAGLAAAAIATGLGMTIKRSAEHTDSFRTDIPIPAATQPHIEHVVKLGETEGSITAQFDSGHDSLDYENMINAQLPKGDRHDRTLRPGEHLALPKE